MEKLYFEAICSDLSTLYVGRTLFAFLNFHTGIQKVLSFMHVFSSLFDCKEVGLLVFTVHPEITAIL